jgi:DNA-binding NarL/FixJ family response regulator
LGACGFLLKGVSRDKLVEAIHSAAAGQSAWTRDELRRVTGALATPRLAADVEVPLTQRESEVLRQLAYGLTNKEIALALHISYETVKEHVQHILRKIGVSDRTQAAVWTGPNGDVLRKPRATPTIGVRTINSAGHPPRHLPCPD